MRPNRLLGFTDAAPLTVLALSDSSFSRSVARSRWDLGKMPHFPLEFVPDQHQWSWSVPGRVC